MEPHRSGPSISVIIPTLNPISFDREFRQMANDLKSREFELIVIDSESEPNKIQSHQSLCDRFISIRRHEFDHGGTRNRAAREARGEYLVFMTQDAIPVDSSAISKLVQPLRENRNIAVSFGRQIPRPDADPIESFVRSFNYPKEPILKKYEPGRATLKTFFSSNVFSCYRRDLFWEVGGFPEKIILNEDMMISAKLMLKGYFTRYTPEAAVWHSHNYSPTIQFKRYFDIGVSLQSSQRQLPPMGQAGDGSSLVKNLFAYLWRSKHVNLMPRAFLDCAGRALGFFLGRWHGWIPVHVKRHLSLHAGYWTS